MLRLALDIPIYFLTSGMPMAINNVKALKTCMGIPPSMTGYSWVKPELGITVPPLPSKLSGTI